MINSSNFVSTELLNWSMSDGRSGVIEVSPVQSISVNVVNAGHNSGKTLTNVD